ncbi:MAG: DUF937 domain-containing protein [Blastocatellia bacterium]
MLLETIMNQALGSGAVGQMSQAIGADEQTTGSAIQAALPLLLGAMANNSASDDGASSLLGALDRDHDGSVLDDVAGFLGGGQASAGASILGHIFGGQQSAVEQGVSRASGLSSGQISQLLVMLAPLVMGALGRTQRQQGLGSGDLAGLLGQAAQAAMGGGGGASSNPLAGILGSVLDRDGDGSPVNDVMGMLGGLLGGRR